MRILFINSTCGYGSTGKITLDLAKEFKDNGHEVKIAYGRKTSPDSATEYAKKIGTKFGICINASKARIMDNEGLNAKTATRKFLEWADEYNPDILWLHNLHGYYINHELLFKWMKSRPQMQVKWTLHDCWAFTGHCSYFTMVKCDNWVIGCHNCPQKKCYPASLLLDNSRKNYKRKMKAFTGVMNMTLITPSEWLKDLVKKSFLKEYPITVKYHSIDSNTYKPVKSNFRGEHNIGDNVKIVLGVASEWNERKGLKDFISLSKLLPKDYSIVLVGLSPKQISNLPKGIIGLSRTNNVAELVEIYSSADYFVNPSKEETFGMTTVEATLCGTVAIVYKNTACEEIVNRFGGYAVDQNPDSIYKVILEFSRS